MAGNTPNTNDNDTFRYTIKLAGQELTEADPKGLEAVGVEESAEMIGQAELTFAGGSSMQWSSVKVGDPVEIQFGGSEFKVFVGVVTGLRHALSQGRDGMTVIAMDPLSKMAASRQVNANFDDMTDSDVATQIIQACGCEVGQVDATTE